jgi:antitoxin (DNA-binding transcriptional repressor) of toxin-antitoxin stability system
MKFVNVRQLRDAIPRIEEELAEAGELVLVKQGREVARVSPVPRAAPRRLPSLKAFRATMPMSETPIEELIRQERDRR